MLTNQQQGSLRFPITSNITAKDYIKRRHPRTIYSWGKEFGLALSVNVATGDCELYSPKVAAVWHLTVQVITNNGPKLTGTYSEKLWEKAKEVAGIALAGVGDKEQELTDVGDTIYHVRRPLTQSELHRLPDDIKALIFSPDVEEVTQQS